MAQNSQHIGALGGHGGDQKTETPTSQITMAWSDLGRRFMLPKNIAPIDPHLQIESHGGFEEEMQQINNLTCNML